MIDHAIAHDIASFATGAAIAIDGEDRADILRNSAGFLRHVAVARALCKAGFEQGREECNMSAM